MQGGGTGRETDERVRLQGNKEATATAGSQRSQTSSASGGPGGRKGSSGSPRTRKSGGFGAIRRPLFLLSPCPSACAHAALPPAPPCEQRDRANERPPQLQPHAGQARDRRPTEATPAPHCISPPPPRRPLVPHALVCPRAALPVCPFCGPRLAALALGWRPLVCSSLAASQRVQDAKTKGNRNVTAARESWSYRNEKTCVERRRICAVEATGCLRN